MESQKKAESQNPGNMPEKKFMAGAVSATIWSNRGKGKNGEPFEFKTISIQRAYKDKDDKWQHTNTMRVNDLPKASLVLKKAYEHLLLKDLADLKSDVPAGEIEVEEIM